MIRAGDLTSTPITTPTGLTLPSYNGQPVPLPAAVLGSPDAPSLIAQAQQVLNNIPQQGNFNPSDLYLIASCASMGAGAGLICGPAAAVCSVVGGILGGIVGFLAGYFSWAFGWIASSDAAQNAEDALGKVINQIQGQSGAVSSANQSLISSLDSLVRQDFQGNASAHWPIFLQQNGQPGSISVSRESECGANWGILCVLYTILHTKPGMGLGDYAADTTYIQMVHEAISNVGTYLNGIGAVALSKSVSADQVSTQIIGGNINLSQILKAAQPASSSSTGLPAFSSASFSGILPVALIGALVLGVVYSGKKRKV